MSDDAIGEMPMIRSDPDTATVVKIVDAGTSIRQPGLYEIHLEVRPERAGASIQIWFWCFKTSGPKSCSHC
jgi:hypothetical protein